MREIRIVRFLDAPNGKQRLMTKAEMNKKLGSGQSMDVCDTLSLRMYPLLKYNDGTELESSRQEYERYKEETESGERVDIYDETNFGVSYEGW